MTTKANHFFKYIFFSALCAAIIFCTYGPAQAYDIDSADKYAWSENTGWFNFKSAHAPAFVYDDHLEGYAWAENIGFVRLGTYTGGDTHTYANNSNTTYGVNNDGSGNLSGYAWSENVRWINFNPNHSQVTVNTTTGEFDGYAWAENIGYVHFKNVSPAYMVKYLAAPTVTTTAADSVTSTTAASGGNVTGGGASTVTARGVCWNITGNPTVADSYTEDGTGTGTFDSLLTGLNLNTVYYIRAYATNSKGTAYGTELQFTTLSPKQIIGEVKYNSTIPVSGAEVTAYNRDISNGFRTVPTDSEGKFWLSVPGGRWEVTVLQAGNAEWLSPRTPQIIQFAEDETEETQRADFFLETSAGNLTGMITDPDGIPLSSPEAVRIEATESDTGYYRYIYPNADSSFSFPMSGGRYSLSVRINPAIYPDYTTPILQPVNFTEDTDLGEIRLLEGIYKDVESTVLLPDKTPAISARVTLYTYYYNFIDVTETDESGNFSFIDVEQGDYKIGIEPPPGEDNVGEVKYISIRIDEDNDGDPGVITLPWNLNNIQGTVQRKDSGTPMPGVTVLAANWGTYEFKQAVTDEDGWFNMQVGHGLWEVRVKQEEEADWISPRTPHEADFRPDSGNDTATLDILLETAAGRLTGLITDSDGSVLPDSVYESVRIDVYESHTGDYRTAYPDSGGYFSLHLPDGNYETVIWLDPVMSLEYSSPLIPPFSFTRDKNLGSIGLLKRDRIISGVVRDSGNNGVPGITVNTWHPVSGISFWTETDADGYYEINVFSGIWMVGTYVSEEADSIIITPPREADLRNAAEKTVSFKLEKVASVIHGQVQDAEGNSITELEAWVYARYGNSPEVISETFVEKGEFRLKVPGGDLRIGLVLPADSGYSIVEEQPWPRRRSGLKTDREITGAEAAAEDMYPYEKTFRSQRRRGTAISSLVFTLKSNSALIRGTLTDISGEPVTGVRGRVFATPVLGGRSDERSNIDPDTGTFEISVSEGPWNLSYSLDTENYMPYPAAPVPAEVSAGKTLSLDIPAIRLDSVIRGRVEDDTGVRMANIQVWARSQGKIFGGFFEAAVFTDSLGEFSIPAPSQGIIFVGTSVSDSEDPGASETRRGKKKNKKKNAATQSTSAAEQGNISIQPVQHNFGSVMLWDESDTDFTVTNSGAAALSIGEIDVSGSDFNILYDYCSETVLSPGEDCMLTVSFSPTLDGSAYAGILIPSDDPDTPYMSVPLNGTGGAGIGTISVFPVWQHFGLISRGGVSYPKIFWVSNIGTAALSIESVMLSGLNPANFDIPDDDCTGEILEPWEKCGISAVFSPGSAGEKSAEILIASDDPYVPYMNLSLNGTCQLKRRSAGVPRRKGEDIVLTLRSPDTVIQGKVLLDGNPEEGAFVWAYTSDGQRAQAYTDADGTYRLDIARTSDGKADTWTVQAARKPVGTDRLCRTSEIQVTASGTAETVYAQDMVLINTGIYLPGAEVYELSVEKGWIHTLGDGTHIRIPANAIPTSEKEVHIRVEPCAEGLPGNNEDTVAGYGYEISVYEKESGKKIEMFNKGYEAMIAIHLTRDQLNKLGMESDQEIRPAYFSEATDGWQPAKSFTVSYNKEDSTRKADFRADRPGIWALAAAKTVQPVLSVTPSFLDIPAQGGTFELKLENSGTGAMLWNAQGNTDWLSISPMSGTNNRTITVTCESNEGKERTGTVKITALDTEGSPITVLVSQETGEKPVLSVTPSFRDIPAAGDTFELKVENTGTGTITWTASENTGWLSVSQVSGTGTGTITVTCDSNSGEERTGTVEITAPGAEGSPVTVQISQASGSKLVLSVTPSLHKLTSAPGTAVFKVVNAGMHSAAAMNWTAVSDTGWLSVANGSSGTGRGTITAACDANPGDTRTGTVTVTAPGAANSPLTVEIIQSGNLLFTEPAGLTTYYSAVLKGVLNPGGLATTYYFEYGPSADYGLTTPVQHTGSGYSDIPVTAYITDLDYGTSWHFRLVTVNSSGAVYGEDQIFSTSACPTGTYAPAPGCTLSTAVHADDPVFSSWASGWTAPVEYGTGVDDRRKTPENAVGRPDSSALSLGNGGSVTMTFRYPITDGIGYDFAVFENSVMDSFLELAYAEVSSDGENFVRFDSDSLTPPGTFGKAHPYDINGLAGKYREGYGTPFDLSDLAGKEEITDGTVDINSITHVRIIDIVSGRDTDTDGDIIYDIGSASTTRAGFDLDAVGVTSHQAVSVIPGDTDGNGLIDLEDAVLALQVCAKLQPSSAIYTEADVSGDGKIGLEEVLYILHKVIGLRP